jgi:flagellar protein FliO/FliZ
MNGSEIRGLDASPPEFWMLLMKSAGMLCIVLAVLILFLYLLKRFLAFKGIQHRPDVIQMLASYHLSPRQRVLLLDILGEKIPLGVTSQQITFLGRIDRLTDVHDGDESSETSGEAFDPILDKKRADKN